MSQELHGLLDQYILEMKSIYGLHLQKIILYGSYARGDFTQESDIDIMILVNMSEEEIAEKRHELSDITFDYNFDNDIQIMPIVKNVEHFNRWLGAYPFYNNVQNEGVELYAA